MCRSCSWGCFRGVFAAVLGAANSGGFVDVWWSAGISDEYLADVAKSGGTGGGSVTAAGGGVSAGGVLWAAELCCVRAGILSHV